MATLVLLIQGISAINRGGRGASDLGVFYRSAALLQAGADGSFYAGHDTFLGWYRCIPPAGLMWFAPMTSLSPRGASVVWVGLNLVFAVVGAFAIRALLRKSNQTKASAMLPWALGLFFLIAGPSLQVGQYSLMFASCWLLALWCATNKRFDGAALILALPAAIKIYPALMLLAPLCVLPFKRWPRFVTMFAVGCALWTWGVPSLFYGARTFSLQSGFWHHVVMSPTGRLSESQSVDSAANHGLDAILLRFGSNAPEPPNAPPHFEYLPAQVLRFANPLRALFVLVALAWWWRRRGVRENNVRAWIDSLALWSATLFLILPGAKSRYAVYAFAAFLPLLSHAILLFQSKADNRWKYLGFVVFITILVMSLLPGVARLWGAGFWGALLLWIENGRLLRQSARLEHKTTETVVVAVQT